MRAKVEDCGIKETGGRYDPDLCKSQVGERSETEKSARAAVRGPLLKNRRPDGYVDRSGSGVYALGRVLFCFRRTRRQYRSRVPGGKCSAGSHVSSEAG